MPARWSALWTLRAHLAGTGRRRLLRFWDDSERGVGLRFAGQFMLVTSWTYFISYLLLFVLPLAAIGVFKLSQLALGPITVLLAGVQSALIALATKRFQVDTRKAIRFLLLAGWVSFAVTMVWTGLVYAAPLHVMTSLFGRNWAAARADRALRRAGGRVQRASPMPPSRGCAPCGPPARTSGCRVVMVPFLFVFCHRRRRALRHEGRPAGWRSPGPSTRCWRGGCCVKVGPHLRPGRPSRGGA